MESRWKALTGVMIGMGSSAIMQTYLSISMPSIVDDLGEMSLYNWVFGAYMLASTVTIPLFGKLADMFGQRRLYLAGLIIFSAGVAFCSLSVNMTMLVFSRILMGVGAGAVTPAALGMIGELFDEKDFDKVFGLLGLIQILSNIAGPLLGGFLSTAFSWRWGFILFLPLELACLIFVCPGPLVRSDARCFKNDQQYETRMTINEFDWRGLLLISAGLIGIILGFQFISWDKIIVGICLTISSVSILYIFARHEKVCEDPVVSIPLLLNPAIRNVMIGVFLLGIIHNSSSTYLSLYYQSVLEKSSTAAGLLLLPMLAAAGVASAFCGKLANHMRYKVSLLLWMLTGLSFVGIAIFGNLLDGLAAVLFSIPVGLGIGFMLPLYLGGSQTHADKSNRAISGGMVQLSRNLGGTLGVSLPGVLISGALPLKTGLGGIFLSLAAVGLSAFVFSFINNKPVTAAKQL